MSSGEERLRKIEKQVHPQPDSNGLGGRDVKIVVQHYRTEIGEDGARREVAVEGQEYDDNIDWEGIEPINGNRFAVVFPKKDKSDTLRTVASC